MQLSALQIIVKELVEDVSVVLQNIQQINTTAKGDTEKVRLFIRDKNYHMIALGNSKLHV